MSARDARATGVSDRTALVLGWLFFALLLAGAFVFYQERALTMEGANYAYMVVEHDACFYSHGRLGACLAQLLPWAARALVLPLRTVLVAFSVSYVLVYLVPFALVAHGLRAPRLALAIPLVLALGMRHLYWWVPSELLQAVVFGCALYAWLARRPRLTPAVAIAAVVAAGALVAWFHVLALVPLLFGLGLLAIDRGWWRHAASWAAAAALLAVPAATGVREEHASYQAQMLFGYWRSAVEVLSRSNVATFFSMFGTVATPVTVAALAVVAFWLARARADRRALAKALWLAAAFAGYVALLLWRLPPGTPPAYLDGVPPNYLEHMATPLLLLAAVPLAADVLPRLPRPAATTAAAAVLVLGVVGMWRMHAPYARRLAYMDAVLDNVEDYPERKFVRVDARKWMWAFPMETLLYSTLTRDEPRSIALVLDPKIAADLVATDATFQETNGDRIPQDELDRRYFPLRRTRYRPLGMSDLVASEASR